MIKSCHENRCESSQRSATGPAGDIRILYAEDDPLLTSLVESIVRAQGWQITCVSDGRKAVQEWEEGSFDLILMDVQMPEMDGLEATRAIRKLEKAGHVPILALTALGKEKGEQCLAAGMDEIVAKPFRVGGLVEGIRRHLQGRVFSP